MPPLGLADLWVRHKALLSPHPRESPEVTNPTHESREHRQESDKKGRETLLWEAPRRLQVGDEHGTGPRKAQLFTRERFPVPGPINPKGKGRKTTIKLNKRGTPPPPAGRRWTAATDQAAPLEKERPGAGTATLSPPRSAVVFSDGRSGAMFGFLATTCHPGTVHAPRCGEAEGDLIEGTGFAANEP
uniref:RBPJ-interacting and tubulin-associated protein n=1 Tax=Steinernema glaseri TaxID=37863 RepID=A0A1I7ZL79_9BILA